MKNILLAFSLISILAVPAFAELTVNDSVSKEYLINHGYSTAIANTISKSVAEVNGEKLKEPVEKAYYEKPAVNIIRKIFMYIDPSLDNHTFYNDYEIKMSPQYNQL